MKTITAQNGQTIYDIAIQEYGDVAGVHYIMLDNPTIGISQNLANVELSIITEVPEDLNKNKADYFRGLGILINSNK